MITTKCASCFVRNVICSRLDRLPFYEEVIVPKTSIERLPKCFEETQLGTPKGALRQFRGPEGAHVLEYQETWVMHRDQIDPRHDPIGHLTRDAPEFLLLGFIAFLGFLAIAAAIGGGADEQ